MAIGKDKLNLLLKILFPFVVCWLAASFWLEQYKDYPLATVGVCPYQLNLGRPDLP